MRLSGIFLLAFFFLSFPGVFDPPFSAPIMIDRLFACNLPSFLLAATVYSKKVIYMWREREKGGKRMCVCVCVFGGGKQLANMELATH